MPFQNTTKDTLWNVWQDGIQQSLTIYISTSRELKVRQTESVNNLIQRKGLTNYNPITPADASKISQKLDANVLIYGCIMQVGGTIHVIAQLIDSKTKEVIISYGTESPLYKENIFMIVD